MTYLHRSEVGHNFMQSMLDLHGSDDVELHNRFPIMCGAGSLVESRNLSVRLFLEHGDEWLLTVDSDMGFESDTVLRLVEAADPVERPIVGGLCWSQGSQQYDGMGGYHFETRPTILMLNGPDSDRVFGYPGSHPDNELVECDATGAACLLVHRSVFEKIEAEYGDAWWDRIELNDTLAGEDVSFCLRAKSIGFPTYVHTGIRTNHLKPCWISGEGAM